MATVSFLISTVSFHRYGAKRARGVHLCSRRYFLSLFSDFTRVSARSFMDFPYKLKINFSWSFVDLFTVFHLAFDDFFPGSLPQSFSVPSSLSTFLVYPWSFCDLFLIFLRYFIRKSSLEIFTCSVTTVACNSITTYRRT
jgi:hypothetical protein